MGRWELIHAFFKRKASYLTMRLIASAMQLRRNICTLRSALDTALPGKAILNGLGLKLEAWLAYIAFTYDGLSTLASEKHFYLQCSLAASHLRWTGRCRTLHRYPGSRPSAHRQSFRSDPASRAAAGSNLCQNVHEMAGT